MKPVTILLSLVVFVFVGCSDDETLRTAVENDLRATLAIGDPCEKIERVLKEKNMPFSFNTFESRYETGIDPKESRRVGRVVTVDIYVDASKRLSRIEVRNTYTYL